MAKLYGEQLVLNDRVFDIANGYGTVIEANYKNFIVHFDNGRRIGFDTEGLYNGVRRVYWHDPVLVAPPKSKPEWDKTLNLVMATLAFVKKI